MLRVGQNQGFINVRILAVILWSFLNAAVCFGERTVISLDGLWQIEEGSLPDLPKTFGHTVPVPGLADLADPPFVNLAGRPDVKQRKDPLRDAFWYRRTFNVSNAIPDVAVIRVRKAAWGSRVFLNGVLLGDNLSSFTSGFFDAKGALKTGENELIVRVAADHDSLPEEAIEGIDSERRYYTPGIYDSVELILSGLPAVRNVQVAPVIAEKKANVRIWLAGGGGPVSVEIKDPSGRKVGSYSLNVPDQEMQVVDCSLLIDGCRLWTPEDPYLYTVSVRTEGDEFSARFGMREFRLDPATGWAVLNGEPYAMRGCNVTLHRFFDDPLHGTLPWNRKWVRLLFDRFKQDMRWNCFRQSIGPLPEMWYEIADEAGYLIQEEYPIWGGGRYWPKEYSVAALTTEFTRWMEERWNHPSIAIWDACNESTSFGRTRAAIEQVRGLDMSGRPWDNSHEGTMQAGDALELHPYHFNQKGFTLARLAVQDPPKKRHGADHRVIVINEYGYLWLNRDGSPTLLTRDIYRNLLGENSTAEQRFNLYASYMAAETGFFRRHLHGTPLMMFAGLAASVPGVTATSDQWIDLENLVWEPHFLRYMRDAFAPVGLTIDAYAGSYDPGSIQKFPVFIMNDLKAPWSGEVRFKVLHNGTPVSEQTQFMQVGSFGITNLEFEVPIPTVSGLYQLEASIKGVDGETVRSLRDFSVISRDEQAERNGLAFNKAVTASSVFQQFSADLAVDGKSETRWASNLRSDQEWFSVDLGGIETVSRFEIVWFGASYPQAYEIQVSSDGQEWTTVYSFRQYRKAANIERIGITPVQARFVRFSGTQQIKSYGYSISEFRVYP